MVRGCLLALLARCSCGGVFHCGILAGRIHVYIYVFVECGRIVGEGGMVV